MNHDKYFEILKAQHQELTSHIVSLEKYQAEEKRKLSVRIENFILRTKKQKA